MCNIEDGYLVKPNYSCTQPGDLMNSTNLKDAKQECLDSPACHMFDSYCISTGYPFYPCERDSSEYPDPNYCQTLYTKIKNGNRNEMWFL